MFQNYWNHPRRQQLADVRNIGLYIFAIIVLAVSWSSIKTVQANYELEKKISKLKQENTVLSLLNQNTKLQNQYYNTAEYQDLAARQSLGLAAPGEKVLLVPKSVALKYINPAVSAQNPSVAQVEDHRSKYVKNIEDWRDFLLGRKILED